MADKATKAEKELSFEEALKQLEQIVGRLEAGNVPLDESLKQYEEGMHLIRICNGKLEEAERRIEAVRLTDDGFVTEPFSEERT